VWAAWLTQVDTGADPISSWIQYGSLGLVIIALLTGLLWAKPAVDRVLAQNDRLRDERSQQMEALIGEVHALRNEVREMRRER
jgi:hypothetical protein